MIGGVARNILEAYRAPRDSARRILDARPTFQQCVLLAVLAALLNGVVLLALKQIAPSAFPPAFLDSMTVGGLLLNAVVHPLLVLLISAFIHMFALRFGGGGAFLSTFAIFAWHSVVTAPGVVIQPLWFRGELTGAGVIGVFVITLAMIYILSAFLAEAHGFKSAGKVMAVMLMAPLVIVMILSMLISVMSP